MDPQRFADLTARYPSLHVAVAGDFCLDRYLEIDPERAEISIETGLAVLNVVRVRAQPGAAGTILCNLAALGIGRLTPVGFCGDDGEGYELRQALANLPGVSQGSFVRTADRRTFTYCKPLVLHREEPPRELSRLDSKNWSPTPPAVEDQLARALVQAAAEADALIVLDQVDQAGTGVVTPRLLTALAQVRRDHPRLVILADSRRGLDGFPPVGFKMNRQELARLTGLAETAPLSEVGRRARDLAARNQQPVIVTLSEHGILGATPGGELVQLPALPVRGPIDIVGAGDAVTANLAAALAAGARLAEALELANLAASIVVHQLGTTGTASVAQLRDLMTRSR